MKRFYQVWWIALVVKTAMAIWLPLSNDEAYYWVWGHHPQLSYFDHPPMVGWLFWIGTWLENVGNAARLPGVWMGHVTLIFWHKILAPYLDEEKRWLWLVFILLSPFFGAGSLVITPDVPLLFFWSLSILLLLRVVQDPSAKWYAALGASLGLGFCSKYLIVLFVPTALAWLAWSGNWRKVRPLLVPLTIVIGLLFCAPVLYWNFTHEWASFKFQLGHGLKSEKWDAIWPGEYLAGQLLILFPTVVWIAIKRKEPKEAQFLHFFGWIPLAFFFFTSFKAHVEANWPIMAHPAILSLAFLNAPRLTAGLKVAMGVWLAAHLIVISEVVHHWLPIDPANLKTSEFTRFDAALPYARLETDLFLGSYQMAAAVSYKTRKQFYKLGGLNRVDFYDFVRQSFPMGDKFTLVCETNQTIPKWLQDMGYYHSTEKPLTKDLRFIEVARNAQGSNR